MFFFDERHLILHQKSSIYKDHNVNIKNPIKNIFIKCEYHQVLKFFKILYFFTKLKDSLEGCWKANKIKLNDNDHKTATKIMKPTKINQQQYTCCN